MRRYHLAAVLLAAAVLPAFAAGEERLASAAGEIVIRPLAHASVRIDFGGRSIYVDPWNGAKLSNFPQSNLIIVTDADNGAHHLDPAALLQVRSEGGTVVIPASGTAKVPDGVVLGNGASKRFG